MPATTTGKENMNLLHLWRNGHDDPPKRGKKYSPRKVEIAVQKRKHNERVPDQSWSSRNHKSILNYTMRPKHARIYALHAKRVEEAVALLDGGAFPDNVEYLTGCKIVFTHHGLIYELCHGIGIELTISHGTHCKGWYDYAEGYWTGKDPVQLGFSYRWLKNYR